VGVDRLLLGANPISGVDHASNESARFRSEGVTVPNILRMFRTAHECGVRGFTYSLGPRMLRLLPKISASQEFRAFNLYPLIPNLNRFRSQAGGRYAAGVLEAMVGSLSWGGKTKALLQGGWSYVTRNPRQAIRAAIDAELANVFESSGGSERVMGVFLPEFFTDAALALGLTSLLEEFVGYVRRRYSLTAGLQTRNFPLLVDSYARERYSLAEVSVMTPFNPLGFQMCPSRTECEAALERAHCQSVVAVSVLAGGQLPAEQAASYIRSQHGVSSVAIGALRPAHIRETFNAFQSFATEPGPPGVSRP